jgi:ATP-binding cassette subfamily B protein
MPTASTSEKLKELQRANPGVIRRAHPRKTGIPRFQLQSGQRDCVVACLKMIADHHETPVTYEWLMQRLPGATDESGKGVNISATVNAAAEVGLFAMGGRISWDHLFDGDLQNFGPFMLYMNRGHFVVVLRIHPTRVLIADPAIGLYYASRPGLPRLCGNSAGATMNVAIIIYFKNIPDTLVEHPAENQRHAGQACR